MPTVMPISHVVALYCRYGNGLLSKPRSLTPTSYPPPPNAVKPSVPQRR